jgi:hypothetical protein
MHTTTTMHTTAPTIVMISKPKSIGDDVGGEGDEVEVIYTPLSRIE